MCIKMQVYLLIGLICLMVMQVGNIPISVLPLMFLSCLFESNIFDSDVEDSILEKPRRSGSV